MLAVTDQESFQNVISVFDSYVASSLAIIYESTDFPEARSLIYM